MSDTTITVTFSCETSARDYRVTALVRELDQSPPDIEITDIWDLQGRRLGNMDVSSAVWTDMLLGAERAARQGHLPDGRPRSGR